MNSDKDSKLGTLLEGLPDAPGVYLHKDQPGRVLYVGKAKSLRSRVRSYFQASAAHTPRIAAMVAQVRDIEIFQTGSESEALILEANLIKKHRPRYNITYKDDKSYPFFKLTVGEMFPRLYLTREKFDKGAEYYGPYASVKDARQTLNMIRRYFKLRTSKMKLDGTRTYRPCINYQLRKCLGPCRGEVLVEDYAVATEEVRLFFQGREKELIARLEGEMNEHAEAQRFEEAAKVRDAVRAVRRTMSKQLVLVPDLGTDQDVFALYRESHFAGIEILFIRHGRLIGSDFIMVDHTEGMSDEEILRGWLGRLYTRPAALFPKEILLPFPVEDMEVLEGFLTGERGGRVRILPVKRGAKRKLIDMAENNAKRELKERMVRHVDDDTVLEEVKRVLHLRRLPERVEAFDISNIQGSDPVASMVVWETNRAAKSDYRKYKIRTTTGPDDFQAMYEVISRRYRRAVDGEQPLPDLILIDGGKGQVNSAARALMELGISLTQVDVIGLAKGRTDRRMGRVLGVEDYEYVVKPDMKNEHRLKRNSTTLYFLQRIRDESHRFAITFHRSLRRKRALTMDLEGIEGVGKKRAQALLRHFGSLKKVQGADVALIQAVPGISVHTAERIHAAYAGKGGAPDSAQPGPTSLESTPPESTPLESTMTESTPPKSTPLEAG